MTAESYLLFSPIKIMFITISIIFVFVLSIFCLTLFYNEHVDAESERQALIASIEKLRAMSREISKRS